MPTVLVNYESNDRDEASTNWSPLRPILIRDELFPASSETDTLQQRCETSINQPPLNRYCCNNEEQLSTASVLGDHCTYNYTGIQSPRPNPTGLDNLGHQPQTGRNIVAK